VDAESLLEVKEHEQVGNNAQLVRYSQGETEAEKQKPPMDRNQKMVQAPSKATLKQALETQAQVAAVLTMLKERMHIRTMRTARSQTMQIQRMTLSSQVMLRQPPKMLGRSEQRQVGQGVSVSWMLTWWKRRISAIVWIPVIRMGLGNRKLVHTVKTNSTKEIPSNCDKIPERATRRHREMDHKQHTVPQGLAWKMARSKSTMELEKALISSKTSTQEDLAKRN